MVRTGSVSRILVGLRLGALAALALAVLFASHDMPATAGSPQRVRTFNTGRKPATIHDKAEGWAEYPSLAVSGDRAFVVYSVSEDGRSGVYYRSIDRKTGDVGSKYRIDEGSANGFWPYICTMGPNDLWLAWTSYDSKGWRIRGALVKGDHPGGIPRCNYFTIYDGGGFNSQVKVGAGTGRAWFVWTNWLNDDYRVLARPVADTGLRDVVTIYQGHNPVGRPDILVIDDDHIVVAWDEYREGRFIISLREYDHGKLGTIRDLSASTYENEWQPGLSRAGDDIMAVWKRVPGTTNRCEPGLMIIPHGKAAEGIDRPDDDETWRVRCLATPDGRNVVAWATRKGYRRTNLYLRAASSDGLGRTTEVRFPMRRTFINWFDCKCDGRLALVYEYSGSLYFYDVEMPDLAGPPEREDAADDEATGQDRLEQVQNQLRDINYPGGGADLYDEGYADENPYEKSGGLRDSGPAPRHGIDYSTDYKGEMLNVYFGDYHNHTSFSDGRAFPDISYLLARDIRGFDFMSVSDHDVTLTPGEFSWNCAVCDNLTRDGEYICLHGYEENQGWGQKGYGHWNVLLENAVPLFPYSEGMTPLNLFDYAKENHAILIPHHIGVSWAPYDWAYFDPGTEPVVEICSIHGTYESMETCTNERKCVEGSMMVDGLGRGYHFGIVGGSDFHNCFTALNMEHSVTGVYAEKLTRRHILNAMRRRRTFATTGQMLVVDFRCNGRFMGEEIRASGPLHFTARLIANSPFTRAEIVSNGEVVYRQDVNSSDVSLDWEVENPGTESYYYLRAVTAKGEFAWSSPIFIVD